MNTPHRPPARARRWPWLVAAVAIATVFAALLANPPGDAEVVWISLISLVTIEFVAVGALLTARLPANRVGTVLFGAGVILAGTLAIGTFAELAAARGDVPMEVVAFASILNDYGFSVPIVVVLIGIPLIFPDGHLLSPRWRWIVVLAVVALSGQAFARLVGPGPVGPAEVPNPFALTALAPVAAAFDTFAEWTSIIGFSAAALAVAIRYQRGNEIERHQLKWLIAVSVVAAISLPIAFIEPGPVVFEFAFLVGLLALLALPVVIGIAILRYRLWDIDRIISRTIGWTIVSGLLVTAFAILVVALQTFLAGLAQSSVLAGFTQGETLAVAASTLIAFALFQPLRRTVQRAVDRRFDRARYDAQRTADAFAERLRDEVDLDSLSAELVRTVIGTMRPAVASIWLPGRES
jgi:hypothetical protein